MKDELFWSLNPSGKYEPEISCKALASKGNNQGLIWWWKPLLKYKCLIKTKIFTLLLLNNKALTKDILENIAMKVQEDATFAKWAWRLTIILFYTILHKASLEEIEGLTRL